MAKERLTQEQVNEILAKHKLWLETDGEQGVRADFSNKDVSSLDFSKRGLHKANFTGSNCSSANFIKSDCRGANFTGSSCDSANFTKSYCNCANFTESNCNFANFTGSSCREANFTESYCSCANFTGSSCRLANFTESYCSKANFTGSNCSFADFIKSDCREANFTKSDCSSANFKGTKLRGAILFNTILISTTLEEHQCPTPIFPEEGSFIAFKKCRERLIVKLEIPADAKRSSGTGRKCRADKVKVLEILESDGKTPSKEKVAYSLQDDNFAYPLGEMVVEPNFCQDRFKECAEGIHFFMSKTEAIEY